MAVLTPRAQGASVLELDENERRLLLNALDSYLYWQLSTLENRRDGNVFAPVSDVAEAREEALRVNALMETLGEPYFDEREVAIIRRGHHEPECAMDEDCTCGESDAG